MYHIEINKQIIDIDLTDILQLLFLFVLFALFL